MKVYLILIMSILIPIAGAAQDNIFDVLNEQYITQISELPYSPGNPLINWRQQGHISAWVDITGFKNLTKYNGVYYIHGDPASLAITQFGYSHDIPQNVDSITGTISYSQSGNNLTASLIVILKWHVWCRSKTSSWICGRPSETKTFQDVESVPEQYNIGNHTIHITEYNNSVNPRTEIKLSSSYDFINYTYNGNHITNYQKIAHVEQTAKGVYFANMTYANIWTTAGTGPLRQMNDQVIIPGTANPDYKNLTIRASSIYEANTIPISDKIITRDTYSIKRAFSGLYISLIIIFSIMFGTLYFTAKRAL